MKQEHTPIDYSLSVTTYLAECRNEKGYSIEDVAHHLRVSRHYIEAIEANDASRFPERVYILGFVRSYAKFLGIDPENCIRRFKKEILQDEKSDALLFPAPLPPETTPGKRLIFLSSAALICLIIVGYGIKRWYLASQATNQSIVDHATPAASPLPSQAEYTPPENSDTENAPTEIPDSDENEEETVLEETSVTPIPPPQETASSPETSTVKNRTILLEFSQPSWIEIRNASGNIVIEKTFQARESYSLPAPEGHTMRTGNAGGVNIKIGDAPVQPLGKAGEVLTNLSLDAEPLSVYLERRAFKH